MRSGLRVAPFAAAVALAACGGSSARTAAGPGGTEERRAPNLVTVRDHGATLRLARGRDVELRLGGDAQVAARGRSVRLAPIEFLVDPGYAAWFVSAAAPGRTVVAGTSGGTRFRVTFVVPG